MLRNLETRHSNTEMSNDYCVEIYCLEKRTGILGLGCTDGGPSRLQEVGLVVDCGQILNFKKLFQSLHLLKRDKRS